MDASKEYNRLSSAAQKDQFAQQFLNNIEQMRTGLTGGGGGAEGSGFNAAAGLPKDGPKGTAAIQKALLNNTSPSERAQCEPLVNKMMEVHKNQVQLSRG